MHPLNGKVHVTFCTELVLVHRIEILPQVALALTFEFKVSEFALLVVSGCVEELETLVPTK